MIGALARRLRSSAYAGDWWELLLASLVPALHVRFAVLHLSCDGVLLDGRHTTLAQHRTSLPPGQLPGVLARYAPWANAMQDSPRVALPELHEIWHCIRWEHRAGQPLRLELFCEESAPTIPPDLGAMLAGAFRTEISRQTPCHVQRAMPGCSDACPHNRGFLPAGSELCAEMLGP